MNKETLGTILKILKTFRIDGNILCQIMVKKPKNF